MIALGRSEMLSDIHRSKVALLSVPVAVCSLCAHRARCATAVTGARALRIDTCSIRFSIIPLPSSTSREPYGGGSVRGWLPLWRRV